ncbi:type III-B CRISPR module-associated Cmr3 family protein [Endozoicomonas acroporae]|uniref:type III-B CRISPR module-associated Cmr3 family protein n=1 Tax=Endozoicomonas acroporae TaxID=1701104 RepID=UPI003D7A97C0
MTEQLKSWQLTLTPVDSWYFRESRPHGAAGGDRLESLFPPPVKTLAGAIRTRLGECLNVDWQAFRRGEAVWGDISLNTLLGDSDSTGSLRFGPVQVIVSNMPLYSWPALLMEKTLAGSSGTSYRYARLKPGSEVHCDLGRVALPELERPGQKKDGLDMSGGKISEKDYVTGPLLEQLLNGDTPGAEIAEQGVVRQKALFELEPRLGIARNQATATVEEGMLYQTSHLRLQEAVSITLSLTGLPESIADQLQQDIQQSPLIRLGAEGRMAAITMTPLEQPLPLIAPTPKGDEQGFMIMLLSEGDFGDISQSPLPGFDPMETEQGQTVWHGQLNGMAAELHTVMAGKPVRRGGWDLKKGRPAAMKSYVPAGSCYFLKPLGGASVADALGLHGQAIGRQTDWGYGRIVCGLWR